MNVLPRKIYFLIIITTFLLCAIIFIYGSAFPFIRSTIGDFLVVMLIYSTLLFIWPRFSPYWTGGGVFAFALTIEFLQSGIIPKYLNTKSQLVAATVGSTFDPFDILAYFCGTLLIVMLDAMMRGAISKEKVLA